MTADEPYNPNLRRELQVRKYESRSENWERYKADCIALILDEAVTKKITLFEHEQGYRQVGRSKKSRKAPSLWSAASDDKPSRVEMASSKYYERKGYYASRAPIVLAEVIAVAEAMGRLGRKSKPYKLSDRYLYRSDVRILEKGDSCNESAFLQRLSCLIELHAKAFCKEYAIHFDRPTVAHLRSLSRERRETCLRSRFYDYMVSGARSISDIVEAIEDLYRKLTSQYFQNIAVRMHWFNLKSGVPDLFVWRDTHHYFIEIKSPRDSLHLNQAYFYRYILRPLGMPLVVGRVLPVQL